MDKINKNNNEKEKAVKICSKEPIGKYFFRFNIIEKDIYNVE